MKKPLVLCLFALLLVLLCGCDSPVAEDLYALPQLSDAYLQLQNEINSLLDSGAVYSAPSSGTNRQAVQLEDIDGDGTKEALAFLSFPGTAKPQKVIIFRNQDGVYSEAARLEGEGTGIESIAYLDMSSDGAKEIAVGWRLADRVYILSVYSMKDFQPTQIINTDYTKYSAVDMDDNGRTEIVAIRINGSELTGEAAMYSMLADGEITEETVPLSQGVRSLSRVRTGRLIDNRQSILIESATGVSGLITDVLACKDGALTNVTLDPALGVSDTARISQVWCRDINGDDVLDIPRLEPMPAIRDSSTYFLTRWYDYTAYDTFTRVATTFNNNTDSWYFTVPESWVGDISVRRVDSQSGERGVAFSYIGDSIDEPEDFLVIYTLSGDLREERAGYGGRFTLASDSDTVYAAEIIQGADTGLAVTEELVRQNFGILYSEWVTGDVT